MRQLVSSHASGLRRYVLPVDHAAPLDDDGFLVVSEGETWPSGSLSQPRPVRELLVGQPSYVLLAAGGVGKTRTFRALSDAEEHARYLDVAVLDRTELRRALDSAVTAGVPVYLDALDQATLTYSTLFRMLGQELTTPAARGLGWRLACRTAAWPASLSHELKEHLAGFEELNLAPLDKPTAQDVVTAAGFDGLGFVDALVQAGRGRLSASPQRLLAAARHWHEEGGRLPDGHLSAIEFEVRQLLTETDDGRTPRLSLDAAATVAKRLGAFASFTGMQLVTSGPASNAVSTSIVDLPSEPEPDEPGNRIGPDEYREVLGTALFIAGPSGGLLFRHQQYAEFLAARYLVDRGITRSQLPALLGVHTNGLLPGARIGVAAWLAALQPSIAAPLIRDNAGAFIAAAIELPEETRAAIVHDLLRQAAEADAGHNWSLDLSGLAHPGLAEQLETLFNTGPASTEQLFWGCRLAVAGECRSVSESIAQQALSSAWPAWVRRTAVQAVASLGDQVALRSLRTLITVAPNDDPAEELLAATIDALYPNMLTTAELLPLLRAAQMPHYFGGYVLSLRSLAERIPVEDLPVVLQWFAEHHDESPSDTTFDDLYRLLVQRAWAEQHTAELRTALAAFLSSTADSRYWLHQRSNTDSVPWMSGDSHTRREFAVTVAERTTADSSYKLLVLCLVTHEDVPWLLDQLSSLPEPAQPVLARCLPHMLGTPSAAIADRILALDASHPAFEAAGLGWSLARFGGAGTVALGSAVISYGHLRGVLVAWHYSPLAAAVGPLVLDGLMVVCGFALLANSLATGHPSPPAHRP